MAGHSTPYKVPWPLASSAQSSSVLLCAGGHTPRPGPIACEPEKSTHTPQKCHRQAIDLMRPCVGIRVATPGLEKCSAKREIWLEWVIFASSASQSSSPYLR